MIYTIFLLLRSSHFFFSHPTSDPFPFPRFRRRRSFGFDYRTLQRSKLMRDVAYEPLLRVPIADDDGGDASGEAVYALYAAVIHSGRYCGE
jgi:hypothetical protein